jgi:hypothetical protein
VIGSRVPARLGRDAPVVTLGTTIARRVTLRLDRRPARRHEALPPSGEPHEWYRTPRGRSRPRPRRRTDWRRDRDPARVRLAFEDREGLGRVPESIALVRRHGLGFGGGRRSLEDNGDPALHARLTAGNDPD